MGQKTMLSLRRRLRRLEGSAVFRTAPDPVVTIIPLALRLVTDEHLGLLVIAACEREAGMRRPLLESEVAAVAAYEAALDEACLAGERS